MARQARLRLDLVLVVSRFELGGMSWVKVRRREGSIPVRVKRMMALKEPMAEGSWKTAVVVRASLAVGFLGACRVPVSVRRGRKRGL